MSAFSVLPYTEEQQERWDRFVMEQSANGTFFADPPVSELSPGRTVPG